MKDLAILYIGALTPDSVASRTSASSAAGEIFQRDFLSSLSSSNLPQPEVLAYVPETRYPQGRLLVFGTSESFANGLACRTLSFLNLGPLKILSLGISAAWRTAAWAWGNRRKQKVILLFNLNAPPAVALLPVCKLFDIHLVPFIGDIYVPGEVVDGGVFRRLEFWIQSRTVPMVDGLLVCNRAIVDDLAPGREAILVEGGVPRAFVDRFSSPPKTPSEKFQLVFAGSMSELNGVTVLLDALKFIADPNLQVTIAGRGPLEDTVRTAALSDSRIDYQGLIPHDRVLEIYENADLLLNLRRMGSRTERYVFPSKVVECLATGRPLLTTPTGHVRGEFGEVVYLLEELTPEVLAQRLKEIFAIPRAERLERARKGQDLIRETRTWEGHARRIEQYLRNVVLPKPS